MNALEQYHFEPNKLQSPKNDSSEDSEVDIQLEKVHFADLVKNAKSVTRSCRFFCFLVLPNSESTHTRHLM